MKPARYDEIRAIPAVSPTGASGPITRQEYSLEISQISGSMHRGLRWTSISQVVRLAVQFVAQLVLAHLLSPADFGIAAMAYVLVGFATILAESGIQAAIVQRKELSDATLVAALAVTVGASAITAIVVAAAAPVVANFYGESRVAIVLLLTAPALLVGGLCAVNRGLLERRMQFRRIAIVEIGAATIGSSTGIFYALHGGGVYSLPLAALVSASLGSLGYVSVCPWRPRQWPTRADVKDLAGFSGNLLGFNVVNYWARNLDNLLIAKYLGATEAGYYTRAYAFLMLPIAQVSAVLGRVMLPSMSSLQEDRTRVASLYLRATQAIATIMWLPLLLLAMTADRIIPLLLGNQWVAAAPIVSVMSAVGAIQVITTTVGWLFLSTGSTRLMLKWGLINSAFYGIAFIVGVFLGSAFWVAITYAVSVLLVAIPTLRSALRLVDLSLMQLLNAMRGTFCCAVVSACAASTGYALYSHDGVGICYQICIGSLTYLLLAWRLQLEPTRSLVSRFDKKVHHGRTEIKVVR